MRNERFEYALLAVSLVAVISANCGVNQIRQNPEKTNESILQSQESVLLGKWTSGEARIEFFVDGTMTIDGERFSYRLNTKNIVVETEAGPIEFPSALRGNTLTIVVDGRNVVYTRTPGN